jgi:hypothetical protein
MTSYHIFDPTTGKRLFVNIPRRGQHTHRLMEVLQKFRQQNAKHVDNRIVLPKELPAPPEKGTE